MGHSLELAQLVGHGGLTHTNLFGNLSLTVAQCAHFSDGGEFSRFHEVWKTAVLLNVPINDRNKPAVIRLLNSIQHRLLIAVEEGHKSPPGDHVEAVYEI